MALTGLFLCLFLVGHLAGNLQLITNMGIEGKRAFNEYAYFMGTNPLIKVMAYLTYISILFHAIDGILLTIQNRKARPVRYAHEKANANSKWYSRSMAVLGSLVLIFIVLHMQNFWWKAKYSDTPMPAHKEVGYAPEVNATQTAIEDAEKEVYYTTDGKFISSDEVTPVYTKDKKIALYPNVETIKKYDPNYTPVGNGIKVADGYKDLHSLVFAFFGHDKTKEAGLGANEYALVYVLFYVIAMAVLSFHLMHGFASAFQSLGLNHRKYNKLIKTVGSIFAIVVPALFAIIPVIIYLTK